MEAMILPIGQAYIKSPAYDTLFRDGMGLIENVATYLEGPGGEWASKCDDNELSFRYATQSLRMTTHLMQIASWLMTVRAVQREEMFDDVAAKNRASAMEHIIGQKVTEFEGLPDEFRHYKILACRIGDRITHIDTML